MCFQTWISSFSIMYRSWKDPSSSLQFLEFTKNKGFKASEGTMTHFNPGHRSNFVISERGRVKNGPERKQLTGREIRRTSRKRRVKGLGERIKGNPIILKRTSGGEDPERT